MNVVIWDTSELWDPKADEVTVFIIVLRLHQHVKVIDATWANTCHCIPIACVRVDIVINQVLLKVISSVAPVLLQVQS